jgi:hypothetical protein
MIVLHIGVGTDALVRSVLHIGVGIDAWILADSCLEVGRLRFEMTNEAKMKGCYLSLWER